MSESIKSYSIDLLSEDNVKKYVLPYYGLKQAQLSQIKFKNTEKQRAVYKVNYLDKEYCLKKVYFAKNELLFVYSSLEWLYRHDIKVPKILPTINNGRFVNYENMLFILTPWIEGIKCDYDNKIHLLLTCGNLAKMHNVTENFVPILGSKHRQGFNNIYNSLNKHFEMLLVNSNNAFKHGDKFSKIFLKYFSQGITLAKKSAEIASEVNLDNLKKSLCHMDYVNKNIIITENNDIWIIDFDKCRMEFSIHDIAYFSRRLLKRKDTDWNVELLINCLNEYEKKRPLNMDEYKYLLAYLAFPQRYWKISRDYYNNISKCNKRAFVSILEKSVINFNSQLEFTNNFLQYIENKFKVSEKNNNSKIKTKKSM